MQSTERCGKAIELRWLLRETNSAPERSKRWPKMSRFNCNQYGKAIGYFKSSSLEGTLRGVRAGEVCVLPPATRPRSGRLLGRSGPASGSFRLHRLAGCG